MVRITSVLLGSVVLAAAPGTIPMAKAAGQTVRTQSGNTRCVVGLDVVAHMSFHRRR